MATKGMRSTRFQPASTLPPPDNAGVITLDQVRPQPRQQNEYVDTPRSPLMLGTKTSSGSKSGVHINSNSVTRERVLLPIRTNTPPTSISSINTIIRSQPISTSPPLKKDLPLEVTEENDNNSIICSKCGKCRCGACTSPKELPAKWLCGDKVKLSPESMIGCCTCMCCVKGLFYHCSKDDQDSEYECVEEPCAGCSRPHCCTRWTCILAMSLCLPCICLYPPAKCGLAACTSLYNKCRKKGCTCQKTNQTTSRNKSRKFDSTSQLRGLLIESDRESSSVSNS